jgi:dolichol-phosphate mannosyltransferase
VNPPLLITMATYNEADNLVDLVHRILQLPLDLGIVIVDDNSPDGTGDLAEFLAQRYGRIEVLHRPQKGGIRSALCAAFQWALDRDCELVVNLDGDSSHRPEEIPTLLSAFSARTNPLPGFSDTNPGLVIGSRYVGGVRVLNWSPKRLLLSMAAGAYVRMVTGMRITDPTSGFRCFTRRALKALDLDGMRSTGFFFHVESAHRLWRRGMMIEEAPITYVERRRGSTKMCPCIIQEALWMTWLLWFQNGLRRRSPTPV